MYCGRLSSWSDASESEACRQNATSKTPVTARAANRVNGIWGNGWWPQTGETAPCVRRVGTDWSSEDIMNWRSNASLRMRVS